MNDSFTTNAKVPLTGATGMFLRVLNKMIYVKYWEQCLGLKYIGYLSLSSPTDTAMIKMSPEEDKT